MTISTFTIVKVALALLVLYGLYLITDILLLIVASFFFAAALTSTVDWLKKRYHIPRSISVLAIYLVLFGVIALAIILIAPVFAEQLQQLITNFPLYYNQANQWLLQIGRQFGFSASLTLPSSFDTVSWLTSNVFNVANTLTNGIASLFFILLLTYFLVVDEQSMQRAIAIISPSREAHFTKLMHSVQSKVGEWLRAQIILMIIIGVMVYVFLMAIGMPSALVLALIAGITELIPFLGPFIGAVPTLLLAAAVSPTMVVTVAIGYYVIQMLENNLIVPKIMERALGLSPIISIVAFLVGARLGGIVGALLAIPFVTAAMVVVQDAVANRAVDKP